MVSYRVEIEMLIEMIEFDYNDSAQASPIGSQDARTLRVTWDPDTVYNCGIDGVPRIHSHEMYARDRTNINGVPRVPSYEMFSR
jgi:hypothetical protein